MTKTDLIQLTQDRAAGGDVTNDTLQKFKDVTIAAMFNLILTEAIHDGKNMLGNGSFGIPYTALTGDYYLTLAPKPLGGAMGVKYVEDDCGNTYFGRKNIDQNVLMTKIRPLALPEFYVNNETLTFSSQPNGTTYTVWMTPDFVAMEDDQEFSCPNIDFIVMTVVDRLKKTNNEPTELINNTKPDKG
jgi:hypothetical protein